MRDSSESNPCPQIGKELPAEHDAAVAESQGADHNAAARVWAALTPLLAGRPRVRESRNGGHTYLRRWERPLPQQLPTVPAAVPLYSSAGDTRLLVIDLDVARGGSVEAVQRDAHTVRVLIRSCGGAALSDESPTGGVHVYIPFAEPLSFQQARDLALAIATRTPSMDPTPNHNLTDGLIRPPGSVHPRGGHQVLHGPLAAARHLAATGNPPPVLDRLTAQLADELAALAHPAASGNAMDGADDVAHLPRRGGPREPAADYLRIATTGSYDTDRYRSPSEARQAVLTSAVWAGLAFPDLIGRLERGTWPGLASFYARYRRPATRRQALLADWRRAVTWVSANRTKNPAGSLVRRSPTSEPPPHGAGSLGRHQDHQRGTAAEYQWIRTWWSAVQLLEPSRYASRAGIGLRWVLRALGEAAMKAGSRYTAFGTRSLAVATGLDHTTVAAHLRVLRSEADPLIDLLEDDRGLGGDLYQLRIPDEITDRAHRVDWPAGKIHGLRPVFRELGHPAALVHEALEHSREPVRSFDLITQTQLSRSAIYDALRTLAAWDLAEQRDGGWTRVAGTSLTLLAEQFGCLDAVSAQIRHHRAERAAYRRALRIVDQHPVAVQPHDPAYLWPPEPPPDDETLFELLERELGAHLIST